MPVKSLSLCIPDTPPYDRENTWFESFVGINIVPIIESNLVNRFWFTRYGAIGQGKQILFRFETDDISAVETHIGEMQKKFAAGPHGYTDYNYVGDIGEGENSRFLGKNTRHQDSSRRGEIAFDFVHAASRLFMDCLSGPNADGYFQREEETTSKFNHETSLEQFHHLFCNLTGVPTFVCVISHPEHDGQKIVTPLQYAMMQKAEKERREKLKLDRNVNWKVEHMTKVMY